VPLSERTSLISSTFFWQFFRINLRGFLLGLPVRKDEWLDDRTGSLLVFALRKEVIRIYAGTDLPPPRTWLAGRFTISPASRIL
jgi:hypothetical protein